MMKRFFIPWALLILDVVCLFFSCEKPADLPPDLPTSEALQEVSFTLHGFAAESQPFSGTGGSFPSTLASTLRNQAMALSSIQPKAEEQLLYLWLFNESQLTPDLAIDSVQAEITFSASGGEPSYTTGFGLSPYPAGKALNLKGLRSITFSMPLTGVSQLSQLAFDVASSGTGPKSFSLSCSIDGGTTFTKLSENNQFTNTKDNARNSFEFNLSTLGILNTSYPLLVKLDLLEGERGEANDYKPDQGSFKVDNFRLFGIYDSDQPGEPGNLLSRLYYFIFDQQTDTLAAQGLASFDPASPLPGISFKLPVGNYYASLFSNQSQADLILPKTIKRASDLYLANPFSNQQAVIFGTLIPSFQVEKKTEVEASMKRYYSQINLDFTDAIEDLSNVHRITIHQTHDPFIYAPFGGSTFPSLVDTTEELSFTPSFSEAQRSLSFNQFMGDLEEDAVLRYVITAYGPNGELLRTVTVQSSIKNNMQLFFKGALLGDHGDFLVTWDETWADSLVSEF